MRIRAAITIHAEAWTDSRFGTLARLMRYADADVAIIRCARLWAWMTHHGVTLVDESMIEAALGPGGAKAMEHASLARHEVDSTYSISGIHRPKAECR